MKKLNKNLLFGLGALGAVVAPVAAVVACGDSSTKKDDSKLNTTTTNTPVVTNHVTPITMRSVAELKTAAYDASTNTINLNKINNQFELAILMSDITALKEMAGIANGFEDPNLEKDRTNLEAHWNAVKTKMENSINARTNETINFISNGKSFAFNLDINKHLTKIVDAIKSADASTISAAATKNPTSLTDGEIAAGAPILSGDSTKLIVSALVQINMPLAMNSLMKLTHLPNASFDAFLDFVAQVQSSFLGLVNSDAFNDWVSTSNVNMLLKADGTALAQSLIDLSAGAQAPHTKDEFVKMILAGHVLTSSLS